MRKSSRCPTNTRLSIAAVALAGASVLSTSGQAQSSSGSFEPVELRGDRSYFSQLPFEAVDMVTGNVVLSFVDVTIPGNAGMGLRVVRSLNYGASGGPAWNTGLAGIPIAIEGTSAPASGPWNVGLVMGDRGRRLVPHQAGVDVYLLDNFMRLDIGLRKVELPNGWTATYETTPGVLQAQLVEAHDPFGNTIAASWLPRPGGQPTNATNLASLTLQGGGDPSRTVYFTYDASGTLLQTLSFEGRTWTYGYSGTDLVTATPPAGPAWQFTYGANQLTVGTPLGGIVTYQFQTLQDPSGQSHPALLNRSVGGRAVPAATWQFAYTRTSSHVTGSVQTPDGRTVEYQHSAVPNAVGDSYWNLTETSLKRGSTLVAKVARTYVACGDGFSPMPSTETVTQDGRTFTTSMQYQSAYEHQCDFHRPYAITQSADLTRTTTQTYTYLPNKHRGDLVGSSTVSVGGSSAVTELTYDADGFLTRSRVAGADTLFARDGAGNVSSITDANGRTTNFTYQWGAVKSTQTPLYAVTRVVDSTGWVESETRRGITTSFTYDARGRITSISAPGRDVIAVAYASDAVVTSQGPSVITQELDGFGRSIGSSSNLGISTLTQYDQEGRVVLQTYPSDASATASNTYTYDDLGRVTSVTRSSGGLTSASRTANTVTTTDENGHATTQHLSWFAPGDGRLTHVTDPAGQNWFYAYNGLGALTTVTQPGDSTRTFTYDSRNQMISATHPESGTTTYTYDDVGNMLTTQDARGITVAYTYDANNRLIGVSGGGENVVMTYDESDNRTAIVTGGTSSTYAYDAANALTSRTETIAGRSFTTSYTYDTRGNLKTLTYPSGRVVQYDYDAGNRLARVYDGAQNFASGLAYHPSGGLKALTFGNGAHETATFDGRYRLSQLSSGPLALTYSYDPAGNVLSITDARPERTSSFTYDVLDRLRTVSGWGANEFLYDALGNRTYESNGNVSATYNAALRLTQATGAMANTFGYDASGNMTSDSAGTYDYTAFNQLSRANVNATQTGYGYNGDNQRVLRTGPEGVAYSVRSLGGLILAEYEEAGATAALVREYVYAGPKLIASIGRPASAAPAAVSVTLVSPRPGTVALAGTPVTFRAQPYLTSGSVARVEFYSGGTGLGSVTSAPYELTLSTLPQGTYQVVARVVTASGAVASSAAVSFTVLNVNAPPVVTLTEPAGSLPMGTGRSITLSATASDANGISKVEFYRDSFLLATDTAAPYTYTWTNLPKGTYVLKAKAFDTLGASTWSAPVTLTVKDIASVWLNPASPTAGTSAVVTIEGAAYCGAVQVDYGDGQVVTHTMSGLAASFTHSWATAGAKTISATGVGNCGDSATAQITVLGPPAVALTAPSGGASYSAPATIDLAATATPAQGTIASVSFYANGNLLGTDTTAPYQYQWTGAVAGAYGLTAVATDTFGATASSASVSVTVGNPPPSTVMGITLSPNPVAAGQPVTITVTGTNPCGMIGIHFDDGETAWLAIEQLPKVHSWTWTSPGTYNVWVEGIGNCSGQASQVLTVTGSMPEPLPEASEGFDVDAFASRDLTGPWRFDLVEPADGGRSDDGLDGIDGIARIDGIETIETIDASGAAPGPVADETDAPALPTVLIVLDLNGSGSGSVSGSVSCSGQHTGCVGSVEVGAAVTLTASPQVGATFTGWTGGCAGTSAQCSFTATASVLVIANFRATFAPVTTYYHLDALGSVRAITDASGAVAERHDFRPFGEDTMPLPDPGADPTRFLGQQRDGTKLDQFGVRNYSMFLGRFTSVDPGSAGANLLAPQSWNAYAYGGNNPLRFVDTTGFANEGVFRGPIAWGHPFDPAVDCFWFSGLCGSSQVDWSAFGPGGDSGGGGDQGRVPVPTVTTEVTEVKIVPPAVPTDLNSLLSDIARRATPGVNAALVLAAAGTAVATAGMSTVAIAGVGASATGLHGAATAASLALPAGAKLAGMISRSGQFFQNPQGFLAYSRDFVYGAVQEGSYVFANWFGANGATIYRRGSDYLVVEVGGRISSFVPNAQTGVGIVSVYQRLGGK